MQSYDYSKRSSIDAITWERFGQLAATLAELVEPHRIDAVVGVARAGLFPATAVACALRRDLYPIRVSRRVQDMVTFERPQWIVDVPAAVSGKRIAVIDEMADTGETLALVAERVRELGANHVVNATLVAHSWASPMPDAVALLSDALIVFPWDRRVLAEGQWRPHPELAGALETLGGQQ
jgi:uncharacterized protein